MTNRRPRGRSSTDRWGSARTALIATLAGLATAACREPRGPEASPTEHAAADADASIDARDPVDRGAEAADAGPHSPDVSADAGVRAGANALPDAPRVIPRDDRIVVSSPRLVEGLALLPDGIAFTAGSEIWTLAQDDLLLEQRAEVADPHGLVSDGTWLYWLGHEANGRMRLDSGAIESLPRIATYGQQDDLAVGDALYARDARGGVWRIEGSMVTAMALEIDPTWSPLPGLGAGKRIVYLPMMARSHGPPSFFLARLPVGGKGSQKIELSGPPRPRNWAVDAGGTLVFLREGSKVMQQGPRAKSATVVFEQPGLVAVCWCGSAVCTFDEDDRVLRRIAKGSKTSEVVTSDIEMGVRVACDDRRVAWSTSEDEHPSEIHLVSLR
ncbi:MAG: hypothetical protein AB1Z98_30475 [Nannocystaceae bacterium]